MRFTACSPPNATILFTSALPKPAWASKGIVATTAAIGVLLQEGIGDTIRASLTPLPNGDRTEEVIVCQQVLQALELRSFTPQVTACPGCGRTKSTFFQDMADQIQTYLRTQMAVWKTQYTGVEEMKVAVMGCVVNGPGESKHSDLGISLPGTFEEPVAPVYVDGKLKCTLRGDHIVPEFIAISRRLRSAAAMPRGAPIVDAVKVNRIYRSHERILDRHAADRAAMLEIPRSSVVRGPRPAALLR